MVAQGAPAHDVLNITMCAAVWVARIRAPLQRRNQPVRKDEIVGPAGVSIPMPAKAPTVIVAPCQVRAEIERLRGPQSPLSQGVTQVLAIRDGLEQSRPKLRVAPVHGHAVDTGDQPFLLATLQPGHHAHDDIPLIETIAVGQNVQLQTAIVAQLPIEQTPVRDASTLRHAAENAADASPVSFPAPLRIGDPGHIGIVAVAWRGAGRCASVWAHPTAPVTGETLVLFTQVGDGPVGANLGSDRLEQSLQALRIMDGHLSRTDYGNRLEPFGAHDGTKAALAGRR